MNPSGFLFRWSTALFLLLVFSGSLKARKPLNERPKLVVRIVIEQMRYEMLLRYWDKFQEETGFKKLVSRGTLCKNTQLDYALTDRAPGFATLTTGANPSTHGIIADYWYNRLSDETIYCIEDKQTSAIGSVDQRHGFSPRHLLNGTLGDEMKMLNPRSKVFSLSLHPISAILGAGNISDGAFWFEDKTGNWMTSSYYRDSLPEWIHEFNNKGLQDTYMNRQWEKLMPDTNYTSSLPDENDTEEGFLLIYKNHFPYNLSLLKSKSRTYKYLKYTPFGNTYTKDFVHSLIINESLGQDRHTDMLTVSFAGSAYVNEIFGVRSMEMEDLFLRLDKQLGHLVGFLEDQVGKDNFILVLTSDRGSSDPYEYRDQQNMPARKFKPKHGLSLMKSYLNIVYNQEQWIKSYTKRQLYLDHGLVDQHRISLADMQETVSNFMVKKSGITYAVKASTLQESDFSDGLYEKLQHSYHPTRSGDIFLGLEAGSIEQSVSSGSAYNYDNHIPLIWYGSGIGKGEIQTKVHMRDIAPTISMLIDIPLPEASEGQPILELLPANDKNDNFVGD